MSNENQIQKGRFLPDNYQIPDKAKQFLKLDTGDNVIRFLSNPLMGWVFFSEDNKPVRRQYDATSPTLGDFSKEEMTELRAKIDKETGAFEGSRHFWLGLVWDTKTESPKILELTQSTILKPMYNLFTDKDWGDLRNYDVNIHKEGSTKNNTEYSISPKPAKPLSKDIIAVVEELEANNLLDLSAIWRNEYPFEKYLY